MPLASIQIALKQHIHPRSVSTKSAIFTHQKCPYILLKAIFLQYAYIIGTASGNFLQYAYIIGTASGSKQLSCPTYALPFYISKKTAFN